MKRYQIKVFNENKIKICMIFSTSYLSPLKFIDEIEEELSHLFDYEITIIFDLFLSSGNTSERYLRANFNGAHFERNSFEFVIIDKIDKIRDFSAIFYKEAQKNVDFSFLNNIQKKMIIKGIAI